MPEELEQLHRMLAFVLENDAGLSENKARSLSSYFGSIKDFLNSVPGDYEEIRGIGKSRPLRFKEGEIEKVLDAKARGVVDPTQTVSQNYLAAISRNFTRKQLKKIRSVTLDALMPNPFLITSLNMFTPDEVVRLNVYMTVTRSIVTSMGFFVEDLMASSSASATKCPRGSGWDLIKIDADGTKHWIQAKSGPNDMDKDQVADVWAKRIVEKIEQGQSAYIGITYGKRTNVTVTLPILKQWLPDWEMHTLIGRELWDFLADDPEYHTVLFDALRRAAQQVLGDSCICDEIEQCIERVRAEFIGRYGDGEQGVMNYIAEIF